MIRRESKGFPWREVIAASIFLSVMPIGIEYIEFSRVTQEPLSVGDTSWVMPWWGDAQMGSAHPHHPLPRPWEVSYSEEFPAGMTQNIIIPAHEITVMYDGKNSYYIVDCWPVGYCDPKENPHD